MLPITDVTLPSGGSARGIKIDAKKVTPFRAPNEWPADPQAVDRADLVLYHLEDETDVRVTARVETDVDGGSLPKWSAVSILELGHSEGSNLVGPLEVRVRSEGGNKRSVKMRVWLRHQILSSPWLPAQGTGFNLSVRWKADDTGGVAPNGFASLTVDGASTSFTDLDNGFMAVEKMAFGVWTPRHYNLPTTTEIPIFFDHISMDFSKLLP